MKFSEWLLTEEKKNLNEFFAKLFAARDQAHKIHLKVTSYAQHKALNEFYEKLLSLLDNLIETYQGRNDFVKIQNFDIKQFSDNPVKFLTDLSDYLQSYREEFSGEHLKNILDEITSLVDHTLYMLKLK